LRDTRDFPMSGVYLITISGEDKPGVSASLLSILAEGGAPILDIGQAVIHETLSLGVLTQAADVSSWERTSRALAARAQALELKAKFTAISDAEYSHWVSAQGKDRHIITLLGRTLDAGHLAGITGIIFKQGLNIDVITRLSGRIPLDGTPPPTMACVEFSVRGTPADATSMRADFLKLAHDSGVDIAFQVDDVYRRNRRLVALDMDSTLIQVEVIDELAAAAGVRDQVAAITESAMRGEIDFAESLERRLRLLAGLDEGRLAEVAARLPLAEGAERLTSTLRRLGFKIAIVSGGFTYFGRELQRRLGIDYVFANELEIVEGKLTGRVKGEIVDAQRKADLLLELAARERIHPAQIVAVGDGANDLPMLAAAGLGIAFRAKPIVRESARSALSNVGLDGILYLIGVRDREATYSGPGQGSG
jgi:phosphoserine phosphatase